MTALEPTLPFLLKNYFQALRPRTLTMSIIPVLMGTALSSLRIGEIHFYLLFSVLFCALFIQIGTNLVNDAIDFLKGADTVARVGPKRLSQSNLVSPRAVLIAGWIAFLLAAISALPFLVAGGFFFVAIVALSILCGWAYTAGPFPLSYKGVAEIFVIFFFGIVLTTSAYYFQAEEFSWLAVVAGLQIGLISTGSLAIANLRDIDQDRLAHKRTLAVRFGESFAKKEIAILIVLPLLLNFTWLTRGYVAFSFPFFTLPMAYNLLKKIFTTSPGRQYNQLFFDSCLLHLCFGILLTIGFYLT